MMGHRHEAKVLSRSLSIAQKRQYGILPRAMVSAVRGISIGARDHRVKGKRVVVVEDQTVFREMLVAFLSNLGFVVQAQLERGADALDAVERFKPDLLIVDLVLPDMSGFDVLRTTHEQHPDVATLVVTARESASVVLEVFETKVNGIVAKNASLSELEQALMRVANGGVYYCSVTSAALHSRADRFEPLTEREREIVTQVAQGLSSKEIARALHLSVKTVSNHRLRITRKLGIRDIAGLTRYAMSRGWVGESPV